MRKLVAYNVTAIIQQHICDEWKSRVTRKPGKPKVAGEQKNVSQALLSGIDSFSSMKND